MINLQLSKWKSILQDIYCPVIGSIWVAPNGIWDNHFAHNKDKDDFHPSVVGRVFDENLKSATKPFNVLLACAHPLITEFDDLN